MSPQERLAQRRRALLRGSTTKRSWSGRTSGSTATPRSPWAGSRSASCTPRRALARGRAAVRRGVGCSSQAISCSPDASVRGHADSAGWLTRMNKMLALDPAVVSRPRLPPRTTSRTISLTREYRAPARTMGRRSRPRALRRGVRAHRLVALFEPARFRAGQSHQCLRDLPADGAGAPSRQAMSAAGPSQATVLVVKG